MKKIFGLFTILLCMAACQQEEVVPSITVEQDSFEVKHNDKELNIPVNCNVPSSAKIVYEGTESGWITLLPSVLKGNGVYSLWFKEYENVLRDRSAKLVITAGSEVKEFVINQLAKPGLSVTPKMLATTKASGEFPVEVGSRYGWSITIEDDAKGWCSTETLTGEGPTTVKLNLPEIPNDETRTGHVTVKSDDGQFSITLTIQHGYARQIGDVIWSKANVDEPGLFGATADTRGKLYQYCSKTPWPNSNGIEDLTKPDGYATGYTDNGIPDWTAESDPCPEGWTIPTSDQLAALTGINTDGSGDRKFLWKEPNQSNFAVPGVIMGITPEAAADAVKGDLKGGIFVPQAGFRDVETGYQTHWWEASLTSRTRPGQNWDRWVFATDYGGWYGYSYGPNYAAWPVRCVAK